MDTFDTVPDEQLYDAALALTLAAGSETVRNAVVSGVLDHFSESGAMRGLLAADAYPDRAEAVRELAHRAVGLARQAAMPQLEAHCRRIEVNMSAGAVGGAQALARELEPLLACIRKRVEGAPPSGQHASAVATRSIRTRPAIREALVDERRRKIDR